MVQEEVIIDTNVIMSMIITGDPRVRMSGDWGKGLRREAGRDLPIVSGVETRLRGRTG